MVVIDFFDEIHTLKVYVADDHAFFRIGIHFLVLKTKSKPLFF
jgi:hypothetical protein